ncbi:MAG: diguanylate cyclase, partial [Deltaproteobacteria bacterium CG17_big_fil_post_rev_8_21_14_2_50_51_6]
MSDTVTLNELASRVRELEEESENLRAAQKSLRESEERLSQIIEGSSIATFVIDSDHIITHCNKAFGKLTGISVNEIIGTDRQWKAFYPKPRPILADLVVDMVPRDDVASFYGESFRESEISEGAY